MVTERNNFPRWRYQRTSTMQPL